MEKKLKAKLVPLALTIGGLGLIAAGFVYEVIFVGIPYQGPTGKMLANYARHEAVAATIRWVGLAGLLVGLAIYLLRAIRTPQRSP